jgi:hypothetical protein
MKKLRSKPLTDVEKKRRQRAKQVSYIKAAENSGYKVYPLLVSIKQLESLAKYYYLDSHGHREAQGTGPKIDNARMNDVIYHAMKMYLGELRSNLIERGFPLEVVDTCINPTDYPADHNDLTKVEVESARLFQLWESQQ